MRKTYVVVIVLACLLCVLSGCSIRKGGISFGSTYTTYKDANKYSVGSFSYQSGSVKKVCIDYVSGDVTLIQSSNRTLNVTEPVGKLSDDQKVHWYLDGNTLYIRFCNVRVPIAFLHGIDGNMALGCATEYELVVIALNIATINSIFTFECHILRLTLKFYFATNDMDGRCGALLYF